MTLGATAPHDDQIGSLDYHMGNIENAQAKPPENIAESVRGYAPGRASIHAPGPKYSIHVRQEGLGQVNGESLAAGRPVG